MIVWRLEVSCFTFRLLPLLVMHDLLDRPDVVWSGLAEPLEIKMFNELRKRHLPRLLLMVGLLPKSLWIHSEFPCHLDVGMGEMKLLASVNPDLILR